MTFVRKIGILTGSLHSDDLLGDAGGVKVYRHVIIVVCWLNFGFGFLG